MSRSGGTAALRRARPRVVRAVLAAALALVAGCGLAACSGQDQPAGAGSESGAEHSAAAREAGSGEEGTILQPGRPGEPAKTLPPGTTLPADRYNRADVNFVQSMVVHHAQALEMGRMARSRAEDAQVRAMADRITDSQSAEILNLSAWLKRHRLYVPTRQDLELHMEHMEHGMTMMPGMVSPAQMDRLAAARGARFDGLFLHSMIRHHEGALVMANQVMNGGRAIVVGELAADVSAGQQAEIGRMQALLKQG